MKNPGAVSLYVVAILSAVITTFAIRRFFPRESPADYERKLVEAANHLNAGTPRDLDKATRLDGVKVGPGNRFTYDYTLTQIRSIDVDPSIWNTTFVPQIRVQMKSAGMKPFFEGGTTVVYRYSGNDRVIIAEIAMTPQEGLSK